MIATGLLKLGYSGLVRIPKMTVAILFFLTVTTLVGAIGTVSEPTSWMFRSLSIWGGMLLFFSLAQFRLNRRQRDNLLYILMGSALLQAFYCLVHLLVLDSPPDWMSQSAGIPRGIFQQQNLAASYLATGLLIAIFLSTVPSFRHRNIFLKAIVLLSIFLCSLIVITSGSRTGILAIFGGMLLIFASRYRQLLRNRGRGLLLASVFLTLGVLAGNQIDSKTGGLTQGLEKLSQASRTSEDPTRNDVRRMMYDSSLELILEKPIFGHGIGRFQPVWHDKKATYLEAHPDAAILAPRLSHPHNELLYWGVEGGLIALSGIVVLTLAFLKVCFGLGWQRGGAYLALLLPITLHTQVELPFYISQLHWLLFISLIAIVATHRVTTKAFQLSRYARACMLGLGISLPVLAAIFFSHSLLASRMIFQFNIAQTKSFELLDIPSRNIYFANTADFIRMQTLLNYAIKTDNIEITEEYTRWAEQRLIQMPDAALFSGLSFAFHHLGDYQRSYQLMRRGLSIYPTTELMLSAQKMLQKLDQDKGLPIGVPVGSGATIHQPTN
ncbi:Wzy polymerase domain-containing protein [Motiliproteus sp.]|uniref:PglL family O-oligosaccharyltransferase n=1 Tax=Motiliproteus sp. TaxID=1898955 RepID=UPI003BA84D54